MKLTRVQSFIAQCLAESPELSAKGLSLKRGIMLEDGLYPENPNRKRALADIGLALIVWEVDSKGSIADQPNGAHVHEISCPVVVERDPKLAQLRTGLSSAETVNLVIQAVLGKGGQRPIRLDSPPFRNLGIVEGVQQFLVNFITTDSITPTQ